MKITTNGKTCPKCESDSFRRKIRSPWMRIILLSKYYKCAICGYEVIVLFGYKFGHRLLRYSLMGIVSIVCTIVLLLVMILIFKAVGDKDWNIRDILEYISPKEIQDLDQQDEQF